MGAYWSSVFLLQLLFCHHEGCPRSKIDAGAGSSLDQPLYLRFRRQAGEKKEGQWGPSQLCELHFRTLPELPHLVTSDWRVLSLGHS